MRTGGGEDKRAINIEYENKRNRREGKLEWRTKETTKVLKVERMKCVHICITLTGIGW